MTRHYYSLLLVFVASTWLLALSDSASPNPDLSAADQLYRSGKFAEAADKYQSVLKADPKLVLAQAGLVRSELRQEKVDDAFASATTYLAAQPNSAPLLAAMGDVQFRLAKMAEAETAYLNALKADPKNVQARLGLARLYRAYALYRQAYNQLQAAHEIAPNDPEVQRRWFGQLPRKERIAALEAYLAGPHPDDAEQTQHWQQVLEFLKATADKPVHACKLVNRVDATETGLESMYRDPRHVIAYGLVVKLNEHHARLELDSGASGIIIGRKAAEKAGLTRISEISYRGIGDKGAQSGYIAVAEHIKIGELEFQDCLVRVADRASITDEDGLIGTDVFSSYLVDADLPDQKLKLSPLPKRPDESAAPGSLTSQGEGQGASDDKDDKDEAAEQESKESNNRAAASSEKPSRRLPQDRYIAPEMANWTKVFRFGHLLLIPTSVDHSPPMLFTIDTGANSTGVSLRAARQLTKTSADSLGRVKGLSGEVNKVYRAENVNLAFSHIAQKNQNLVTLDLSNLAHHVGTEVSGFIGFTTLRLLEMKIDYRDGLVDFVYDVKRFGEGSKF